MRLNCFLHRRDSMANPGPRSLRSFLLLLPVVLLPLVAACAAKGCCCRPPAAAASAAGGASRSRGLFSLSCPEGFGFLGFLSFASYRRSACRNTSSSLASSNRSSRSSRGRSTTLYSVMRLPIHPVPEALEPPRAPFGFEFLLQQLPPSLVGFFTSLRQQQQKLQPQEQLLLLAAAREFVLHNASALKAYGGVRPRLQQQLQDRYKELLQQIAEEQQQILSNQQQQQQQEQEQQQEQQQKATGGEAPLGETGVAARVSLQQLRAALRSGDSLDAATAQLLLQQQQQRQPQQQREPEPLRVKPPAVLLALDEIYGHIYDPQVLKKQLIHYLKTEGAPRCRQLLRLNRGVLGRHEALLLLRQLQQQAEQQQHEILLQQLQQLQQQTDTKMASIHKQREIIQQQLRDLQQQEQHPEQQQQQQQQQPQQHQRGRRQRKSRSHLESLEFALQQLEKQQQLAAEQQQQQQQQLQQQAVVAVAEAARVLHRGFLEHGALRAKPLNHWRHRRTVTRESVAPYLLARAASTPWERRRITSAFADCVAAGRLFAACRILRLQTSMLELRGRPEVVHGFLRLYDDLNARGKELQLHHKQKQQQKEQQKQDNPEQQQQEQQQQQQQQEEHLNEKEALAETDTAENMDTASSSSSSSSLTTRNARFHQRKAAAKATQRRYALPASLKTAVDSSSSSSTSSSSSKFFSDCSYRDVAFLRKVYLSTIRKARVQAKLTEVAAHWGEEEQRVAKEQQLDDYRARRRVEREKWFAAKGIDLPYLEEKARQLQLHPEKRTTLDAFFTSPSFNLEQWLDETPPGLLPKQQQQQQQEEAIKDAATIEST